MDITLPPLWVWISVLCALSIGGLVGAGWWLRQQQRGLAAAVTKALQRQIQHGNKIEEALRLLQREQHKSMADIAALAAAHNKLRQDVQHIARHIGQQEREMAQESATSPSRMLH